MAHSFWDYLSKSWESAGQTELLDCHQPKPKLPADAQPCLSLARKGQIGMGCKSYQWPGCKSYQRLNNHWNLTQDLYCPSWSVGYRTVRPLLPQMYLEVAGSLTLAHGGHAPEYINTGLIYSAEDGGTPVQWQASCQ